MKTRILQYRAILLALAFAAVAWGYRAMLFDHAPAAFSDPVEDMSFAWFVPLFSLYIVWRERREILGSLGEPSWVGLLASLPFLAAGFLGTRGIQLRLEEVGFIGLMVTLPWAFFGRRTAARLVFPAAFLLFCIPLSTFLDVVTVHLRILASTVSCATLKAFGADVVRSGTAVLAGDGSFAIDVANPCSGMRSLFAMMALTAGYAYLVHPTWTRRALLFALSVPIAVCGNVVRIVSIAAVAEFCSPELATGFYHDYSGYVVFLVAISLMLGTSALIAKGAERCAR